MQLFNKSAIKKTFVHTWYIYPLLAGIVTVIWLWAFYAYHQPSKHQLLTLFFSTNVKNTKFVDQIMKHYEREDLRQVSTSGLLPDAAGYYSKLQTAFSDSDLLILDEATIQEFEGHQERIFYNITDEVKTDYLPGEHEYYTYTKDETTYTYGVLLKKKGEEHTLQQYMDFDELRDYYICVCLSSVNAGILRSQSNKAYDNALTFMNYLLEL